MCPYNCFLRCKNSQQFLGAICYSKTVLSENHKKYFNYVSPIPLQPTFLILRHILSPWNRYNIKVAFESCRSLRFNFVNIQGLPSRFVEIYLRVLPIYLDYSWLLVNWIDTIKTGKSGITRLFNAPNVLTSASGKAKLMSNLF